MKKILRAAVCAGWLALWCAGAALAHKGSDAYLDVQQTGGGAPAAADAGPAQRAVRFTLAVAIKDLDLLVPMDANADGKVTWGETRAALPLVLALVNEAARIEAPPAPAPAPAPAAGDATACRLDWRFDGVDRRSDGSYVRLVALALCPAAQALAIRYTLLSEQDANHRLLVAGRIGGKDLLTTSSPLRADALELAAGLGTAAAGSPVATSGAAAPASARSSGIWPVLRDYFLLGVHHLLEGYDHLAFLLALVLPLRLALFATTTGVAAGSPPATGAAAGMRTATGVAAGMRIATGAAAGTRTATGTGGHRAWWVLLRTVTAFTLGHSITLMLATFGWTQASPRWVEPVIALSIAVTALLNLRPVPWIRTDVLALLFGMVHGFGFAGLLQEAAAPTGLLPWALAGFNLGVEAGQLIAVAGWVSLSQAVVARSWYATAVVRGGSMALVVLAGYWFWQRVA